MSFDLSIIAETISKDLLNIGLADTSVTIQPLDDTQSALIVRVVSRDFEGLTFLDREMRVRPAISRALSRAGQPRVEFIVEPVSPDDTNESLPDTELLGSDDSDPDNIIENSPNRARWRLEIDLILKALRDSAYEIVALIEGGLYRASRTIISDESLLIGFAQSVSAKTIDIIIRAAMESARSAQSANQSYYLSPRVLIAPFANQGKAKWLKRETTNAFLHLLNSSKNLAKKLSAELIDAAAKISSEHQGPVIEPDIRDASSGISKGGFFAFAREWLQRPGPSLLVVMAPAGHGKTTLSHELTRIMVASFLTDDPPRPVPVMVPFESVRRVVDFESLLFRRLGELRPGPLGAFLPLLHRGEAVVVVDGFDELANDAGFETAENQVRSMKFLFSGNSRVVLAGRSLFTEDFAESTTVARRMRDLLGNINVDVVEILPFDENNIEQYIVGRTHLTSEQRDTVVSFSRATPDHEQLCSNPLFLKILCTLAARDGLAASTEIGSGVELLVRHVCEREETRQHLGIGTDGQLSFLRWVALEVMATGKGVLRPDLEVMAQLSDTTRSAKDPALIGKLVDHALLDRNSTDRIDLIHPYIRDILIGGLVLEEAISSKYETIGIRDLPEASIRHIATSIPLSAFPPGWLSTGTPATGSRVRRNLFRIAISSAVKKGDPRSWIQPNWLRDDTVRAIDLSDLRLKFLSFDNIKFNVCDFSRSIVEECDIRSTQFLSCTFSHTLFQECRGDVGIVVERGAFEGATVTTHDIINRAVSSATELRELLVGFDAPILNASIFAPNRDALRRVHELVRECLQQFAVIDPAPRFFQRTEEELKNAGTTDREMQAVEKAIAPGVYSRLCEVSLSGGSVKRYTLDKRYHTSVVDFLRTGGIPPTLSNLLGPIITRATRMLS